MIRAIAVVFCISAAAAAGAQTFATDFNAFPSGTRAQDLHVPGLTFSSSGSGYIVTDASPLVFSLLSGQMLAAGDNSISEQFDDTPLNIAFASPVSRLEFDYYVDFPVPGGTSDLEVTAYSGNAVVGSSTFFPSQLTAFLEGHAVVSGSASIDRVTIVSHDSKSGYTRGPLGIDNVVATVTGLCTAIPNVVGAVPSGNAYVVSWNSTSTTAGYEIQEATKSDFSDAITVSEPSLSRQFQHIVTSATAFYYRVRPVSCGGSAGAYGPSAQTVVIPPQPPVSRDFDLVVPFGSTTAVSQDITFRALSAGASFTSSTDKPYLTVTPPSGTVRGDGTVTVTVRGDPTNLPVGANTGTVIIVVTSAAKGSPIANDTTTVSKPVSISLVTPVVPVAKGVPPNDALIIPAVAHLEGVVPFRSDIRITNAGVAAATDLLSFTPSNSDGTTTGRQTTITVQPNQTVALNDVLKDFFGFALPSDQAGGVLDIRVITGPAATTFVSSRTYAATPNGTYGQFIPAVPLSKFLKAGGGSLVLTQVSQSDAFRTNIGLVEGLGAAASGRLRVFSSSGQNLGEFPFTLLPFEFVQLNSFLASKGISTPDARAELVVDSPGASVTTYASVVDQHTNDPLLVSPLPPSLSANRFVLPGMADFATSVSNFHSDIRIYNASAIPVNATATFYPQGNGQPIAQNISIAAGEIKVYNNVLPTLFGATGTGGAIVVTTPSSTPLIVSGRTYSNDGMSGGTFGQFIPAVTPADGIGLGDSPLQVLQLEQSTNFRSNLGLNELTGNPVTVNVALILPDSKTSPSTDVPLAANQFLQLNSVIASLNPGSTYNARITVAVTSGTGRVTAYGSVIDNLTSDPTYVPAQK